MEEKTVTAFHEFGVERVSTGCLSDLQKATQMARHLVTSFGVGLEDQPTGSSSSSSGSSSSSYGSLGGPSSVCLDGVDAASLSESLKQRVEAATHRLLSAAFSEALALLKQKHDELQRVAHALLQYETLTADEIRAAAAGTLEIKKEPLQQLQPNSSSSSSSSSSSREASHVET
ncbi:hypothetical protein Emag_005677 [Eimeria magna]